VVSKCAIPGGVSGGEVVRGHTFATLHEPIIQQRRDAVPDVREVIVELETELLAQPLVLLAAVCQEELVGKPLPVLLR
jgi:hypothetical protein